VKSTGLVIAAALLAVLSGIIWWSNKREAARPESEANASPKILSFDQSAVISFSIERKGQPTLTLAKNGGDWQITAPAEFPADQDSVSSLLSALCSLSSQHLIEDKLSDLAPYGLVSPDFILTTTLKDKQTEKLLIGDQTPAGNAYYAMLAGKPRAFTIAGYSKTSLDKSTNDLRDKRLLNVDFDRVSQIELRNAAKKQELTLARGKDTWQIQKPAPYRTDSDRVEDLVRTLREAKMDLSNSIDNADPSAAFKSGQPFVQAKLTAPTGAVELEIRKAQDKDDYYAKSSAVRGIYKIASTTGAGLNKSLDDFRNKKLFDFTYQEPEKIEIHDGPKSYFLTRSGSDWWGPDGKQLDSSTVDSVVEKIRSLTATTFPDSGFLSPNLELTVTSNQGKRVERISICKNGNSFIAKRENEAALYELSASAVPELQDAAGKVKAAAPPPTVKK
jgi:hypothetical protein